MDESVTESRLVWPVIPFEAWSRRLCTDPPVLAEPVFAGLHDGGPWQGLPLGGFGTGGIGRGYRGAFGRWTLKAGVLKHFCVPANIFSVRTSTPGNPARATVLHPGYPVVRPAAAVGKRVLQSWDWSYDAESASYHALFPKAWYHYPACDAHPVELLCEQFSPVIPGDYVASSYPVGVFNWHVRNPSDVPVEVSIMFTFTNMTGWFTDSGRGRPDRLNAGNSNASFRHEVPDGTAVGVTMGRNDKKTATCEEDGQFCIAAVADDSHGVTFHTCFNGRADGAVVWEPFLREGRLENDTSTCRCTPPQEIAGAVCVSFRLAPGESTMAPMVLAWDLPVIEFGSGRRHWRQYTRHVGRSGTHAADLAVTGLTYHPHWSRAIDRWHRAVTSQGKRPPWYYSMLLNEAYLTVDGLTVWTDGTLDARGEDPFFGIIECPDYPYYCTLDLWVYGSFILLKHWPDLERNVMRRFARAVLHGDTFSRRSPHDGRHFQSKVEGAAPHDFGQPEEDPPEVLNSYIHQNSNHWKDLNCQFVLALFRDVQALDDDDLLETCWPPAKAAIDHLADFDSNGDGLIENDGTPDQTMDNIPMKGISSYCGGLWIAALHAALRLADRIGDQAFRERWESCAKRALATFDRELWHDDHYRFDTCGHSPDALFIDALFGIWYGRLCGLHDLVPDEKFRTHLGTVYRENVVRVKNGAYGGINITGWNPPHKPGPESAYNTRDCQISEILAGLNLSFACQLQNAGLTNEADNVLKAVYRQVYEDYGLWFRTPAAWTLDGKFRAIMNLRPLVIWALDR